VAELCIPRIRARGGDLELQFAPDLPLVQSDRVILRQILLDLFNRVLQMWERGNILLAVRPSMEAVVLEVQAWTGAPAGEKDRVRDGPFQYWIDRLNAHFSWEVEEESVVSLSAAGTVPLGRRAVRTRYILELPRANQAMIYVVDDHEPAIRIIQRYLSHSNVQVIGITDPSQVLSLAKSTHPQAILLDVMMPSIDGWEILQKVKSDPETQQIAVIICSVWDQPELAFSLGANGFLKKPINQAELVSELARLNSLGSAGELRPTGS
jgi:CheY-like chemotaxis protein